MTILRRLGYVVAGMFWFAVVFFISLYLTFPSAALAQYAIWKVQDGSDTMRVSVAGIAPSGFGVRGDDVVLYKKAGARLTPMGEASHVWLSSGPWSLFNLAVGRKGTVRGAIAREGGDLAFSLTVANTDEGIEMHAASLTADGLPLSALPPIAGAQLSGTGGIDVAVDLVTAEGNLAKSNGKVSVKRAGNLVIKALDAPGTPLDGVDIGEIAISGLDLSFDVKNGKGKISTGEIATDLATAEVLGQFTLSDNWLQSRLQLKLVLTLTEVFDQKFGLLKGVLSDALWADQKYHYALSGTLGQPRFRADRERKARPASRPTDTMRPDRTDDEGTAVMPPPSGMPTVPAPTGDAAADRVARREQAISDRRLRMEERRRQLQAGGQIAPMRPDEGMPGMYPKYEEDGGPVEELPPGPDEGGLPDASDDY